MTIHEIMAHYRNRTAAEFASIFHDAVRNANDNNPKVRFLDEENAPIIEAFSMILLERGLGDLFADQMITVEVDASNVGGKARGFSPKDGCIVDAPLRLLNDLHPAARLNKVQFVIYGLGATGARQQAGILKLEWNKHQNLDDDFLTSEQFDDREAAGDTAYANEVYHVVDRATYWARDIAARYGFNGFTLRNILNLGTHICIAWVQERVEIDNTAATIDERGDEMMHSLCGLLKGSSHSYTEKLGSMS